MKNDAADEKLPKLSADKMNDRGADMLAAAILFKTAEDYYYVCDEPLAMSQSVVERYERNKNCNEPALLSRGMIELFLDSELFYVMSNISKHTFRKVIYEMKTSKRPFPKNLDSIHMKNAKYEIKMPKMHGDGKKIGKGIGRKASCIGIDFR